METQTYLRLCHGLDYGLPGVDQSPMEITVPGNTFAFTMHIHQCLQDSSFVVEENTLVIEGGKRPCNQNDQLWLCKVCCFKLIV